MLDAMSLMKSMREGCLNSEKGLDLPNGPSTNGEPQREDGTEITGETTVRGLKLHATS